MPLNDTTARWLSRPVGFAPVVETGPVRLHWYPDGASVSACGNHGRPLMSYAAHPRQEPCPRCVEGLLWAGEPVPAMPEAQP